MKTLFAAVLTFCLIAITPKAHAQFNFYDNGGTTSTNLWPPGKVVVSTNGPAVPVNTFVGRGFIVWSAKQNATGVINTNTLTVQDSSDGANNWTNISGATAYVTNNGAIQFIPIDFGAQKKYLRVVQTLTDTNSFDTGAALWGRPKYLNF